MTENDTPFNIEEELKKLPASPGVYLMHDEHDEIIYVGKAISLKNRVRQYFQSSRNKTAKESRGCTVLSEIFFCMVYFLFVNKAHVP